MALKEIILKRGKESNLQRKHPWIFSGAIHRKDKSIASGDQVVVLDSQGHTIAVGHYTDSSIAVRILSFEPRAIDLEFYKEYLSTAKHARNSVLSLPSSLTNCYRLIAGEGDFLPGLIIDMYDDVAVIQCHTAGMLGDIDLIAEALDQVFEESLDSIYLKAIHIKEQAYESQFLKGCKTEQLVKEHDISFHVDWTKGQKTGFFLDQRENRFLIQKYAKGRRVLNTFCYTGGFSLNALKADAELVHSIDISQTAMDQTDRNVNLNNAKESRHKSITGNVIEFLNKSKKDEYDLIILDPPAFAKNRNKSHNAVQAYKRINLAAMQKIGSNGIIFTFSCSQVVDRKLFENTIRAAAIESGRNIRILHHLNQAPDHTVNIYHQEGHYLKGLVIHVE